MVSSHVQPDLGQQNERLEAVQVIEKKLRDRGDEATARKLQEVLQKWQAGQLNIGFCGHFSAGKSTMINQLIGKNLLPSSPIPTSANLVVIRHGSPKALIHFTDGEQTVIDVTKIEQWKDYCKNGQEVEKVEIFDEHPLLEQGLQLLDTPGIDSTDEAHQAATEAALHLADIIFFISDYNHVQSELNFEFIRSLKEKGKTLLLIVNQVDKHRDEELSFSLFHERIETGLKEWGIEIDGILYTSLKRPEHRLNQFEQLFTVLDSLKLQKLSWIEKHALGNVRVLLSEHKQFLLAQRAADLNQRRVRIEQIKLELNWDEEAHWFDQYTRSLHRPKRWQEKLTTETHKILENAILTPYVTTQLAQAYIASRQKDFKVGLLFTGKKTEQEREHRLNALYQDLQERIATQVEWHLKELLRKTAEKLELQDQSFFVQIMEWTIHFPQNILHDLVQTGTVSNEYVYTYTKTLVQKVQQLYRKEMEHWSARGTELMAADHKARYAAEAEQEKINRFQTMLELEQEMDELVRQINQQIEQDSFVIKQVNTGTGELPQLRSLLLQHNRQDRFAPLQTLLPEDVTSVKDTDDSTSSSTGHISAVPLKRFDTGASKRIEATVTSLEGAKQILDQLTSSLVLGADLERKAARLRDNRFTVCLFGAFSAGKSSFANALLGEAVLPVSPNPTTAAINQVLQPTEEHPSGTAVIRMKGREQVREEVLIALERLQLVSKGDTWEILQQIKKVDPHQLRPSLKPYYTFLSACLKGWAEAQALLNTELSVGQIDYAEYVAVEHKACFVESIQLYHDNPLTAQGIEIIDTPGADSIYSRHTNVTFNYIKNADVIIYVTYYNHAFSRADRQFLDQLGRVKDQFALDKMFFLVNAADLAESEEELQSVVEHVQENLLRSGIRFPRTFPVSSLRALQGKADQGMQDFMEEFVTFIQQDLTQLLIDSAQRDIALGLNRLEEMREELQGSQEEKARNIQRLEQQHVQWQEEIGQLTYHSYLMEIEKEMQEHTFHIKQRLLYNFLEHIQDAFHPSVLSGKSVDQSLLYSCLEEFLHNVTYQLKEELKATSLRLEGFIEMLLQRAWEEWQRNLKNSGFVLSDQTFSVKELGLPDIPKNLPTRTEKEWKDVLRHFKSPKQFFEQEGKTLLRQELEKKMPGLVEGYLQEAYMKFVSYYQHAWSEEEKKLKARLSTELEAAIRSRISVLRGEVSLEVLQQMIREYEQYVWKKEKVLT